MKKQLLSLRNSNLLYTVLMLIVGVLAYLLLINRLGFYGDDWYLIFDAHTQGPEFLHTVFSGDRPARAYVLHLAYIIFGDNLIYYHLSAFLFRFLASMALYWTLNMVWKQNKFPNFLMALFFLVYPGFLSQVQPVDYQSQICSLCLAMISIMLTVKAVQIQSSLLVRILLLAVSTIAGWFYLALVEYFIGMEFLRLFFVACVVWQEVGGTLKQKIFRPLVRWLPFSIIPAGFLIWRVFIFKGTRAATDVSLQLGTFFESPLRVGLHWLVNTLYGTFNTIFSAWIVPFYKIVILGGFRLRDTLLIFAIGIGALIILLLGLWASRCYSQDEQVGSNWIRQAIWGGLVTVFVGVIPIIMTNRTVNFDCSRYTLASAPGAIMILVAGISLLKSRRLQLGLVGLLVLLSVTTHFGNALNHVYQADSLRDFWWQVSWRAPQIERGTTLVADYSLMEAPEAHVIWGPANLIYYPEKQDVIPVQIQLPAALPNDETANLILGNGSGSETDVRGNLIDIGFGSMLVITQAAPNTCVRILDGSIPELSMSDSSKIKLISSYSQIDRIKIDSTPAVPPELIFGPEPEHTWCYYYQKAALARQSEDWQSIIALGEEAKAQDYSPNDRIEWLPFLQAYVALRQMDELEAYPGIMNEFPLVRFQTCQVLTQTASSAHPEDLELQTFIDQHFCNLP